MLRKRVERENGKIKDLNPFFRSVAWRDGGVRVICVHPVVTVVQSLLLPVVSHSETEARILGPNGLSFKPCLIDRLD